MTVEEIVGSLGSQIGIDVAAFLDAVTQIDDRDASLVAALTPCPLAIAALDARPASGISVARTFNGIGQPRSVELCCPSDQILITVALFGSDMSVANNDRLVIEATSAAGTICVTGAGERLVLRLRGACDLLHLAVPTAIICRLPSLRPDLRDLVLSDPLIERIGRLLSEAPAGWLCVYADLLSQITVARLLQLAPALPPCGLPKWRLTKVRSFVDANLDEPLRLSDLAAVAGLSRMHFAAQFRVATGQRPHAYVLSRRIARAKQLMAARNSSLVQIALDAGFQSQAHFCTIFKRLSGVTPSTWQRAFSNAGDLAHGERAVAQFPGSAAIAGLAGLSLPFRAERIRPVAPLA